MKRIFTFLIAFLSVVGMSSKAADAVFNVVVPVPTYEVWVTGNFQGDDWGPKIKMTKVDDTHYTVTLNASNTDLGLDINTETVKYKYCSGDDWAYVMKDKDGNEVADLVWDNQQDTVVKWAAVFNPNVAPIVADVVVEAYVAKNITELYLTGSFNGWKSPGADGTKMNYIAAESDNDGNFFRDTIHTDDAAKLAYKFAAGPSWSYEQTTTDWKLSDPNLTTVLHDELTFKRIYPGAANLKTVTINVTAPEGTQSLYMMGSQWGWDGASWFPGTKNTDGTFTFSVPNVDFFQYKYWRGRDWKYEEKQADGTSNLASDRAIDAQVSLTYTDVIASWDASYYAVAEATESHPFESLDAYTDKVGVPSVVAGKVGNALKNTTDSSFVRIPTTNFKKSETISGEVSVSFWYKVDATPDRAGIISVGNYDSIPGGTLWNNHLVQGFKLFREGNATKQRIKLNVGHGADSYWNDGKEIDVDGSWMHITIVISNVENKIFFNGVAASDNNKLANAAPQAKGGIDWTNCNTMEIGSGQPTLSSQGWNHKTDKSLIDELKIWNVALSDLQVAQNYWLATGVNNPTMANNLVASFNNGELRIDNYAGKVRLFDLTGKMLLNKTTENGVMQLDLNKGIYILNTTEGNMKLIVK